MDIVDWRDVTHSSVLVYLANKVQSATLAPCSVGGSSRRSASGRGIATGDWFRGRPRTPARSRVKPPKAPTVFEIPKGF